MQWQKPICRFYAGLILPVLVIAVLCLGARQVLVAAGEYTDLADIAKSQQEKGGLYGSALHQRVFYYKQELYRLRKPAIAALGSSRVLQIRADSFKQPFVNLGSMSDLDEAMEMARDTLITHKPELILIGVDFWWFHPDAGKTMVERSPEYVTPEIGDFIKLPLWIFNGKISLKDIAGIQGDKAHDFGISARTRGDGYAADGSWHYASTLSGATPPDDPEFAASLRKIGKGEKIFAHADKINMRQLKKLADLVTLYRSEGVSVIVFLPPVAPQVMQAMRDSQKYAYVDQLRMILQKMAEEGGFPFFDFHDPAATGTTACEFIDGHHGGVIAYQRQLLAMALANPDLAPYVDLAKTAWHVETFKGQADTASGEKDFLKIGCEKK